MCTVLLDLYTCVQNIFIECHSVVITDIHKHTAAVFWGEDIFQIRHT